jgi:hypothetical protein
VLTSPLKLATYLELASVLNVEDLYNMLEIIEAKEEFEDVARLNAEAQRPIGE